MRLTILLTSLISVIPHAVFSQQTRPQDCAAISDQQLRLQCFDKFFPLKEDLLKQGKWQITEQTSEIDGSREIIAVLLSRRLTTTAEGRHEVALAMRCSDGETSAYLVTSDAMEKESPSVTYRVNDSAPVTEQWVASTGAKAVGLWSADDAIPFLSKLEQASVLAVRIEDHERWEAIFHIGDISTPLQKVREGCL